MNATIRRVLLAWVAAVALACGATPPAAQVSPVADSSDWPTYAHDAQRTGFNPDETRLGRDSVGLLAPAWQADVGTNGVPSAGGPIVSGNRVFVGSSVATGDNFFAFDAATGSRLWSASVGYVYATQCLAVENVGVPSTSAVSGQVVVVGGGDGAYYGLAAATGALLWRHDLAAGPSGYAWSSPLIANGRAYFGVSSQCDDPPVRGELRAVDLATGAPLASAFFVGPNQVGAGVWSAPALTPDGTKLVVTTGEDDGTGGLTEQAMVALDAGSLAILAASKQGAIGEDLDFASSPVVFQDVAGRTLVAANHKDGNLYAFALDSLGQGPLWERPTGVIVGLTPAYDPTLGRGGTLFFAATEGQTYDGANGALHAVDPDTGRDRWPPAHVGSMMGNIAIANRLIFINRGRGGVLVLDEATGQAVRTLQPADAGDAFSGIAVAGGAAYWLSGSVLNAWRLPPA